MSRPYRTHQDERDAFRALAHPVRRKMLTAMAERRLTFDQVREVTERADATTAQHLRVFREARLLDIARVDGKVTYRTRGQALRAEAIWLSGVAHIDTAAKRRRKSA